MKTSKLILLTAAVAMLAASCDNRQAQDGYFYLDGQARLAGRTINLEMAVTAEKKERGLSGQRSISDRQGMVFVYDTPVIPNFWMKDMNFPIDIIWIRDGKVVDMTKNAPSLAGIPDEQQPLYRPKTEIDKVLELQAGWAERNGLKEGDEVSFVIQGR